MSDDANNKKGPFDPETVKKMMEDPRLKETAEQMRASSEAIKQTMNTVSSQVAEFREQERQRYEGAVQNVQHRDTTQTQILHELRAIRALLEQLVGKNG